GRVRLRERLAAQHGLQRRLPFSPSGMIAKNRGLLAAALALAACSSPRPSPGPSPGPSPAASASAIPEPNAPPAADDRPAIVFLGTSLTAGFGLDVDEAYPALIQKKLDSAGLRYRVVNAGVSGETSAGARRRARAG